jgi:hypothetical protein
MKFFCIITESGRKRASIIMIAGIKLAGPSSRVDEHPDSENGFASKPGGG